MFLLIDNYDSFTYNLVQAFYEQGITPTVLHHDDERILDIAESPELKAVCISPGPGKPENAGLCMEFLKKLPFHIPVLGVCLGHQLLGYFAGANISQAPYMMHGKASDIIHNGKGFFENLPNPMKVARYHSLIVQAKDDSSNPMFTVTARGPEGEVMALQYNDRPWVGVQFHPESILTPEGKQLLSRFPSYTLPAANRELRIPAILDTLLEGKDLSAEMAAEAFSDLLDGRMTSAQAGSFLTALRMKGESPLEISHAVRIGLSRSMRVDGIEGNCIDIAGTGGDGRSSFNCSTATALSLAGLGYKVVKHGNKAVSSMCGSADALESLGFPLNTTQCQIRQMLDENNFAFLYAPCFHPAFKNVGDTRKELGIRTLFNLLGPLINPARPTHLLLGVAKPGLVDLLAETLKHSHIIKAAIIHGAGGYDELTPIGASRVVILKNGQFTPMTIDPADYGIPPCTPEDLAVHSRDEAVKTLRLILSGEGPEHMRNMVALNLGMAIFLMEDDMPVHLAMAKAKEAVAAGTGRRVLHVS